MHIPEMPVLGAGSSAFHPAKYQKSSAGGFETFTNGLKSLEGKLQNKMCDQSMQQGFWTNKIKNVIMKEQGPFSWGLVERFFLPGQAP